MIDARMHGRLEQLPRYEKGTKATPIPKPARSDSRLCYDPIGAEFGGERPGFGKGGSFMNHTPRPREGGHKKNKIEKVSANV